MIPFPGKNRRLTTGEKERRYNSKVQIIKSANIQSKEESIADVVG